MWKLYEHFHIFYFQKSIVSEETICKNTVFYCFRNMKISMYLGNVFFDPEGRNA